MALWLEDYSQLHALFAQLRAEGVEDLPAWLREAPDRIERCAQCMQVLRVNQQTLTLFEADSQASLMARLHQVIRGDARDGFIREMDQLWHGENHFESLTVNYTLSGKRLDLSLKGVVLTDDQAPWDRVLVAMEDITPLQTARKDAVKNAQQARTFFEQAPISLWVEDFSRIKVLFDDLRRNGITDFRTFLEVHPNFTERCMREIRVIDVNDHTLQLFKASSRAELISRVDEVFSDEMRDSFAQQLIELWEGRLTHEQEVQNNTLQGETLHIYLKASAVIGHEQDWGMMLLSLTDITARKKAEAYLEYLGQHDVLTKLKNRSFFVSELGRLAHKRIPLVSFIALDLNNLKHANDLGGHAVGDDLLRRFGEVLNKAIDPPGNAARMGGDEFVVVLPNVDETGAQTVLENIRALIEMNNQYHSSDPPLSVAAGVAICRHYKDLEQTALEADRAMYEDKHRYYKQNKHERRSDHPHE